MTPRVPSPIQEVMQSTAARPGTRKRGRMNLVSRAPTNSSRPKSSSRGSRKLAMAKMMTSPTMRSRATPPWSGPAMAERTGLPDPAPNRVSQAKTQPTHRTITHTGAQVKHSLRRGRFWIKEAPSRAAAAITAEMVRMATHSRGRRVPRRLLMKSARIFTRMVQVPWNFTGIIKMRIPTAEGIRNMARFDFCLTGMGHLRDGGSGMGDVRPPRTAVRGVVCPQYTTPPNPLQAGRTCERMGDFCVVFAATVC